MVSILRDAVQRFSENDGWAMSSHVAMSIMLSLFPFMLFSVSLASALTGDGAAEPMIELIFGVWPEDIAAPIVSEIRSVIAHSDGGLMTLGGLLAIWFASNGADAVRTALSRAYRDDDPRPFWKTRALSIVFVLFGSVILLGSVTIGLAIPTLLATFGDAVPQAVLRLAEYRALAPWLTLLLVSGLVFACHIWLPGLRHSLGEVWPGVVFTLAVWVLAVLGFSYYLQTFADYSATYAGLAGAMAALIFLYLMAAILILGAELNGALLNGRGR
jgi:membrane protein